MLKAFTFWIRLQGVSLLVLVPLMATAAASWADDTDITVEQAMQTAEKNNPELATFLFEIQAAEGRLKQVSLPPNPEVAVEVENISGNLPGARQSENTVAISQLLELGNKRPARTKKASAEIEVLRLDYESLRLNVIAEVNRAFIALLGAQKRLELTTDGYRIASQLASSVSERVAAGAVSPVEETRAKVAVSVAEADVERAKKEVEEARQELAKSMGATTPFSQWAEGELPEQVILPELDFLMGRLNQNPDLRKWELERNSRDAALAAERSLAIPDLSLSGGYRRLQGDSKNTFVIGLSVPLPLFNRNQGAIRAAEAALSKTEPDRRVTEASLRAQLAQRYEAMAAALREVRALREGAVAGAQSAYEAVSEGYNLGKFPYLDVLDAWKSLIETKMRYAEALVSVNAARADIERLTAGPLEPETKIQGEK